MSATASALAHGLAAATSEEVVLALQLMISVRPEMRDVVYESMEQEPMKRYVGTVQNFRPEKGFGFISSEDLTSEFGKDVFVSDKEILHFRCGDSVTFTIVPNRDNKPQARLLQSADGSRPAPAPASGLPSGARSPAPPTWGAAPPPRPSPPVTRPIQAWHTAPPPAKAPRIAGSIGGGLVPTTSRQPHAYSNGHGGGDGEVPGRFEGTIANFMPDRHFGFINCPAANSTWGKDVFLSDKEILSFQVGDEVSFSVYLKGGKPQARHLDVSNGEGNTQAHRPVREGNGMQGGMSPSGGPVGGPLAAAPAMAVEGARFLGVIDHFSADRHYGFVKCEDTFATYGKDVFLSDKELKHFGVGSTITFSLALNARGHPQARELEEA